MSEGSSLSVKEIIQRRKGRLQQLRKRGIAYPNDFRPSGTICEARRLEEGKEVSLAGRLNQRRTAGKAIFGNLTDGSESSGEMDANSIQLYANVDTLEVHRTFHELDFGDVIGVHGTLFKTRKGELTVKLASLRILSKCLQPYPGKKDELKVDRQRKRRYLDLAARPAKRELFRARAKLVSALRRYLEEHGFLEVETPMLHQVQGGAAAKPFVTRHAALKQELFLRIAPELYLKRLLVGGFDRVYEINRSFRNEGMSDQHNPEFTMLEFYAAYQDYEDFMKLMEDMLRMLVVKYGHDWRKPAGGGRDCQSGILEHEGISIDFNRPFARFTLAAAIAVHFKCAEDDVFDAGFLMAKLREVEGEKTDQALAAGEVDKVGKLQMIVFEKYVEHTLIEPTFITAYPASVSPLARRRDVQPAGRPELVDRFELYVVGRELANGFSELNDPAAQAQVFEEQILQAQAGNEEAMQYDEDYIKALHYGMPPAAGLGVGIDRLAMLLFGARSIRDVILFPQQRREAPTQD